MTLIDTDLVIMRSLNFVQDEVRKCVPAEPAQIPSVDEMFSIRNQVEEEFEGRVRDFDEIRRIAFKRILKRAGSEDLGLVSHLNEAYLQHRFQAMVAYGDVVPTLDCLAPHFKLGLLSNGNNYPSYYGLEDRFDFEVFAQDVRIEKPDPRIFQITARKAGCELDQLLHVGDSLETDVAGAQSVGAHGVWLNREGLTNDTGIKPDHEIATLADLPGLLGIG